MFSTFIILASLLCPTPIVKNITNLKWNGQDTQSLKYNNNRCSKKFINSPCLIRFTKIGNKSYVALCGSKR